jgi:hypothetical protein
MAENRVKRWRDVKRQRGMKSLTVWFSTEQEARLKDLAATWHCSPSDVLQQIFDQYQPVQTHGNGSVPDTDLIRQLVREALQAERAAMQAEHPRLANRAVL